MASRHNLEEYLERPVKELVAPPDFDRLKEEEKERHRIFMLMLMALTYHYWNGNKYGRRDVHYPLNPTRDQYRDAEYLDKDYIGHNIAAIAVNARGYVIDFEFNHNALFSSSVEHAESRLMRRVYSLTQVPLDPSSRTKKDKAKLAMAALEPGAKYATEPLRVKYATELPGVTVYTSLESCSQCSGIMALGKVAQVVFLQDDPGMYFIGNILRRLTEGTGLQAPLPISAEEIGLKYYEELNQSFEKFEKQQEEKSGDPFSIDSKGKKRYSASMTSFLCTRDAYDIFGKGARDFDKLGQKDVARSNKEVLERAKKTLSYACSEGQRGTPHRS